ncbi:MAG: DNA polymerase III subunit beta [Prevotellaceae bacterium]|jgi:DNA polymerase-3 subunit beta|nr:DNA polymerase III subunit beta [Prevotellaceae bacterium]
MKFIVSSTELLSHLLLVGRVISNKNNNMPILDNFLFRLAGNELNITASDLETTLDTVITIDQVDEEGAIAVPAKLLTESLRDFAEQPLTFIANTTTHSIEISWAGGKFNIPGSLAEDYPAKPALKDITATLLLPANTLLDAINCTLYATADDELRPMMNGIYFDIGEESTSFVASDAHKLVDYTRKDVKADKVATFILSKKPANLLKNILGKITESVKVELDSKNAVFTLPNYSLICRLIEGTYPAYRSVIPTDNSRLVTVDRVDLLNCVRRVSVFSNQASNLIKLKIAENELTVSAQDLDFSVSAYERLNCQYTGEDLEIGFKSTFLCDILNNLTSVNVLLKLADASRAGLILPVEKGNENEEILTLLMPMMIGA